LFVKKIIKKLATEKYIFLTTLKKNLATKKRKRHCCKPSSQPLSRAQPARAGPPEQKKRKRLCCKPASQSTSQSVSPSPVPSPSVLAHPSKKREKDSAVN